MDAQSLKLSLIEKLLATDSLELLGRINSMFESEAKDWWDEISEDERQEIQQGLDQADRGELISHKEVMSNPKKWL